MGRRRGKKRVAAGESLSLWLFTEEMFRPTIAHPYKVDIRAGCSPVISRIRDGYFTKKPDADYTAVGSRIYRIGGDAVQHGRKMCYPKEVYYCDAGGYRDGDGRGLLRWENGPLLIGGKPNPLVVTVNGKIYALAGDTDVWWEDTGVEKLHPTFEVLDPHGKDKWEALEDPPFKCLYSSCHGPQISSHTVVGSTIFMRASRNGSCFEPVLYSFDTDSRRWAVHGPYPVPSRPPSSLDNLRVCPFGLRADVVDNKLFMCDFDGWSGTGATVFAYDLSSSSSSSSSSNKEKEKDDAAAELCGEDLVILPIHGLDHVTDPIGPEACHGFVTHLFKNTFCLVALFWDTGESRLIRVCTFEVAEEKQQIPGENPPLCRYLSAHNVQFVDYDAGEDLWVKGGGWCKVRS